MTFFVCWGLFKYWYKYFCPPLHWCYDLPNCLSPSDGIRLFPRYHSLLSSRSPFSHNDTGSLDEMDPPSFQYPVLTLNDYDEGNDIDSHNRVRGDSDLSADDQLAKFEWLSPLRPRDKHRAVRRGRVDGVGDWLLQTPEFLKWYKSEDCPAGQVLFCYGAPGAGKTCLRYETPGLP